MKTGLKLHCIAVKILSIATIILGVLFTPIQYYICKLEFSYGNLITFLIISLVFPIMFGWMQLIKTNNPITRYNLFSLNPKWKSKMNYSMEEKPGQLFELDAPDESGVKRVNRNKAIDKILK